jgi:hypothetical protein
MVDVDDDSESEKYAVINAIRAMNAAIKRGEKMSDHSNSGTGEEAPY